MIYLSETDMAKKPSLVISTGAGISAESGISTFRDSGGQWEKYDVMEVASHDGWLRNPELIHRFYNARRRDVALAMPNEAHKTLVELEDDFDVTVITQNVDDLHERAGQSKVIHLHGELSKVEAVDDSELVWKLQPGNEETTVDTVIDGHHVRPHIVFFGEAVPMMEPAVEAVAQADIFVIIGTSMVVYPAAALLRYVRRGVPVYYIDPNPSTNIPSEVTVIKEPATTGVRKLAQILRQQYKPTGR